MKTKQLKIAEIELIAFSLAKRFMTWDEPIPKFGSRYPHILESCLAQPFAALSKGYLYKGLVEKASILFYLMIKNHPFQNGNKRIAVITLLTFLLINGKWLTMNHEDLYNFAVGIAKSKNTSREETTKNIQSMLKKHLTEFNQ